LPGHFRRQRSQHSKENSKAHCTLSFSFCFAPHMYNIQKKIASQHYAPLLYASSLNNIQKKIASIRLGAYGAKKNLTA